MPLESARDSYHIVGDVAHQKGGRKRAKQSKQTGLRSYTAPRKKKREKKRKERKKRIKKDN